MRGSRALESRIVLLIFSSTGGSIRMKSIVAYFDASTKWLKSKTRREILIVLGGALGTVTFGLYTLLHGSEQKPANITVNPTITNNPHIDVQPRIENNNTLSIQPTIEVKPIQEPSLTIETTYRVCVGYKKSCPPGSIHIDSCSDNAVSNWAKKECNKYIKSDPKVIAPGYTCSTYVVEVKCTGKKH
jgi:hypothetical protein